MVRSMIKLLILSVSILGFAGCAALPFLGTSTGGASNGGASSGAANIGTLASSVPNPSVFDYAGRDIKVPYVSPAALLDDSLTLEAGILQQQCRFQTPDPLFLVPVSSTAFMFDGRLNEDRSFQVLSYRSMLMLGLGRGTQQLSRWPVKLAALGDMPKLFLEERLDLPANAKLAPAQQQALAQEFIDDSKKIQTTVERLEKTFDPDRECPPRYR
jgi:hypothetical protein